MRSRHYESVEQYYKMEYRNEYPMVHEIKRNRHKFIDAWSNLTQGRIR